MEVLENQQLKDFVSMRIGGPARFVVHAKNEQDIIDAAQFATENNIPLVSLGSGTNVVFSDIGFNGVVVINELIGVAFDSSGKATFGAGENWDEVVEKTVENGFIGIEAMSLVPGTVGATPVNNVGAYGQEISDTLVSVRAYDTQEKQFVEILNQDCGFAYRTSRFKQQDHGRFIICSVTLQLLPYTAGEYTAPQYPALTNKLKELGVDEPTPKIVRDAVVAIRSSKLPDPKIDANVGSFFKNPIVEPAIAHALQQKFSDMPVHNQNDKSKLSAGWLIEHAGLKGERRDGILVSDKQALVLINESATSYDQLKNMVEHIQAVVYEKFGIRLEPEPEIL